MATKATSRQIGLTLTGKSLAGYLLPVVSPTNVANVFTCDYSLGNEFLITTAADTQIKIPVPAVGQNYVVHVKYTGNHVLSWAFASGSHTLKWENGAEPTQARVNGKQDKYVFSCVESGITCGLNGGRNF